MDELALNIFNEMLERDPCKLLLVCYTTKMLSIESLTPSDDTEVVEIAFYKRGWWWSPEYALSVIHRDKTRTLINISKETYLEMRSKWISKDREIREDKQGLEIKAEEERLNKLKQIYGGEG